MKTSAKFSFACFLFATLFQFASLALNSEPLFWIGIFLLIGGLISWED